MTISEAEKLYQQAKKDLDYLQKVNQELKKIHQNTTLLSQYYQKEWLQHYDQMKNNKQPSEIINEDAIWNALTDQHQEKIKILKNIINHLD